LAKSLRLHTVDFNHPQKKHVIKFFRLNLIWSRKKMQ